MKTLSEIRGIAKAKPVISSGTESSGGPGKIMQATRDAEASNLVRVATQGRELTGAEAQEAQGAFNDDPPESGRVPRRRNGNTPAPPHLVEYRNQLEERRVQLSAWLEGGGTLKSSWVTCCPFAAAKNLVLQMRLPEAVEAIRTGHFDHLEHDPIDLKLAVRMVCADYNAGCREAEQFNRLQLMKAITSAGLKVKPKDIEARTEQPKKNDSQLVLTGFVYDNQSFSCPRLPFQNVVKKGKDRAAGPKKKMPGVTFAGAFLSNRAAENLARHTGLYPLDFDNVDDLELLRKEICADPHVALCFASITLTGLKVCVASKHVTTAEEYSREYARVMAWAEKRWGIKPDPANSDCSRLCFLSYDENVYANWNPERLHFDDNPVDQPGTDDASNNARRDAEAERKRPAPAAEASAGSQPETPVDWSGLEIPDLSYEGISLKMCCDALRWVDSVEREIWRKVGAALKLGYGNAAFEVFDHWSSFGGDAYRGTDDVRYTWDSHAREDDGSKRVIRPQSILKWARDAGWRFQQAKRPTGTSKQETKPVLHVFGDGHPANEFCVELFQPLGLSQQVFLRGGQVFYLLDDPQTGLRLELLEPAGAVTFLEHFATFVRTTLKGETVQTTLDEKKCRVILKSEARFRLPPIEAVVAAPVLSEVNGKPVFIEQGYNRDLRLYVSGALKLPEISLDEAVMNLLDIVRDYDFSSPSDKSRAIGNFITPALKQGRFIKGHVPISIYEADCSQSGKTKLAQTQAAIYGEQPSSIAQRTGGVGSVDEALSAKMLHGRPFILLDNWRGPMNSMFLESVLTDGGQVTARAPRTGNIDVDSEKFFFALSSNGFTTTIDLCNRAVIVRIKKRAGYRFPLFAEGSLPRHVQANHALYLASVYAVVKEWLNRGKPRNEVDGHSFVEWAGVLDWIVQTFFRLPPLLRGHAELAKRIAHPNLVILRQVCLQVEISGMLGSALRAHQLADLATANHIDIGVTQEDGSDAPALRIGKLMQSCFQEASDPTDPDTIECDDFYIRRAGAMLPRVSGAGTYRGCYYAIARTPIDLMPDLHGDFPPDDLMD